MSPAERLKVLLFLASFFGATGFLLTLLSSGTEYWLLAAESCGRPQDSRGGNDLREGKKSSTGAVDRVRIFHEGLFWRCSFMAASDGSSIWDLWLSNQPPSEVCHAAFLFPFPVNEPAGSGLERLSFPTEAFEHPSAIVYRTFWSIFLATGLASVVVGGFVVLCAGPLTNHTLYKVGGALLLCGGLCLLAVVVMYLMWVQVLDTLEQYALHQRVSTCPSYHLSIQHGPSFLLAPVAVFFWLLAGPLCILIGRSIQGIKEDKRDKLPELPELICDSLNMEDTV